MTLEDNRPAPSYLLPFALLAISFAALLIFQIANVSQQYSDMQKSQQQFAQAIEQRKDVVKQSGELQAKLQAVAVDLLELSKTDEKAKQIVEKYKIQQTGTPSAPAPSTPAPAAPAK